MGSRSATNEKALAWCGMIGGIEGSRYLEAMCIVRVLSGALGGNWNQAFEMLRK
jgi:hypothetical protein